MNNFNKVSRIILRKNSIWLILLSILFILGTYFSADTMKNSQIRGLIRFIESTNAVKDGPEVYLDKGNMHEYKPDNFYKNYDMNKLQKELNEAIPLAKETAKRYEKELEKFHNDEMDYYDESADFYYELYFLTRTYDLEKDFILENGNYKYNGSEFIFNSYGELFAMAIVFSLLFMSLEHLTSYYKFTQIYPWKKTETFVSKIVLTLILLLGLYIISMLIKYGVFIKSDANSIITLANIPMEILISIMIVSAFVFITMGIGAVAGNFIGHLGLMIIVFGGYMLIRANLELLYRLITDAPNQMRLITKIDDFIRARGDWLEVLTTPIAIVDVYGIKLTSALAFLVVGIVFLTLGYWWTKHSHNERSGLIAMRPEVSIYAQILATSTTALTIWGIFNSMGNSRVLSIGIFVVVLVAVALFYNKMFKVKVGISWGSCSQL